MKKVLIIMLSLILLVSLVACGGQRQSGSDSSSSSGKKDDATITCEVNGETIELRHEFHHGDLFYKANYTDFYANTLGSVCQLVFNPHGEVLLNMFLVYYKDKSIDEVMSESDNTISEKTVNGMTFKYFEYEGAESVPGRTYLYYFEGTTYTICFESFYDMTDAEKTFLENVRFEKQD